MALAQRLVEEGTQYFRFRTRRFGKSLKLVELVVGRDLLRELHIHDR